MFKNLLFDWSGTLCDDMALTIEATNYVLAQYRREPLDCKAFRNEFQLPYPDYYAVKIPEARLEDLENYYRYAFDNSATGVTLIPHAKEFVRFCRARGIRCFILTSMDPKAFREQATLLGMYDYFEHIHSGIHNKEHYIATLMQMHGLNPAETAFVGDMQHDIRAAHCAGITGIGVLTGYNNPTQLAEAEPDLMVPDLAALRALIQRTQAPQQDCICLNGLELLCRIGVPSEERATPQRLTANISLASPCPFTTMAEDIARTIDYHALSLRLAELAAAEPTVLLETLAHKLATCCVQEFGAPCATVELHKYILPQLQSTAVKTTVSR
ncbi:MAG: HAD family hydrolase [Akkermansiaceae bacterium]|nr:HAD family hydrolase [Akkermansiaceae bacterium]